MRNPLPKLIITTGEPAGIGPDIVLSAAMHDCAGQIVAVGNTALLQARANALGIDVKLTSYTSTDTAKPHRAGYLPVIDLPLSNDCQPGEPDPLNASYVLTQLELAASLCLAGEFQGMVTAPVHKAVINDAGTPFSGHTEFLASTAGAQHVVMLLATGALRVALATTHLPLRHVPDALSSDVIEQTLRTLHADLVNRFGISEPRIAVLGLNPHAGEGGHLGLEDQAVIAPVCEKLRDEGMTILGPLPADSAFVPAMREATDAYLAMYHDQGLPVLKALGFHDAVNITLGLPIIRTSVDHGTALDLAGTGKADVGSINAAIKSAFELAAVGHTNKITHA